ncbi:MAG: type IV conjugative transfer system protein TraE [Candidatus Micrarchaeia archaeon]
MLFEKYVEEKEKLKQQNKLLKFFVIVIGVAVVFNSIFVYSIMQNQKIIIVPPAISDQMFIQANDASDEYIVNMARFISNLMLTYNPGTARSQFNHFLKFCFPDSLAKYKTILYDTADKIETGQVSSVFYPHNFKVDRKAKKIYVTGLLNQYTHDKQFITNENKAYVIDYSISNGYFYVKEFVELKEAKS